VRTTLKGGGFTDPKKNGKVKKKKEVGGSHQVGGEKKGNVPKALFDLGGLTGATFNGGGVKIGRT